LRIDWNIEARYKVTLLSVVNIIVIAVLGPSKYWVSVVNSIPIAHALFWTAISLVASTIGTRLPLGRAVAYIGEPIDIAGIIIVGPIPIIVANVAALLINPAFEGRERLKKLPFNITLWVFAPLLAGWVFSLFHLETIKAIGLLEIVAIVCTNIVYSVALVGNVAAAISITEKLPFITVVKKNYKYTEIASLAMIPVSIIMVVLWSDLGEIGVLLLLVPIILVPSLGVKVAFERGRLEEKIRKENQVTEFGKTAASVLHEMGKPISRIVLVAEKAMEHAAEGNQQQTLQEIIKWAQNAGNLAKEMFSGFSWQIQLEKTKIEEVLSAAIALMPVMDQGRVTIINNTTVDKAVWDAKKIELVVSNLLINAVESSSSHNVCLKIDSRGQRMFFSKKPNFIVITVVDQGHGLPSGPVDQIFDPLFSTKKGGRGIGLFLCKQIALAHGGDLVAVPGSKKGAEFMLKLPIDAST